MDRFTYLACSSRLPATHNAAFFVEDRRAFVDKAFSRTDERHGLPMSQFLLSFSHRPKDREGIFLDLAEIGAMRSYSVSEDVAACASGLETALDSCLLQTLSAPTQILRLQALLT